MLEAGAPTETACWTNPRSSSRIPPLLPDPIVPQTLQVSNVDRGPVYTMAAVFKVLARSGTSAAVIRGRLHQQSQVGLGRRVARGVIGAMAMLRQPELPKVVFGVNWWEN
jgi:hypothetical protein